MAIQDLCGIYGAKKNLSDQTATKPISTFDDMPLSDAMREALALAGYTQPTVVQAGLIPLALQGLDLIGQAQTGTGKTAAFAIPILERLQPRKELHGPQALIMTPTRELAVQVRDEVTKLAHGRRVHCVAVYGGKPIREQIEKLRRGAEIIVGTPGRVLDHMSRGTLEWSKLQCVVLDRRIVCWISAFAPTSRKFSAAAPRNARRCC